MREIKFRAWIPDDAEMVPDDRIISLSADAQMIQYWDSQGRHVHHGTNAGEMDDTNPVARAVILQYTGRKDKNGKEIYEGDIITLQLLGDDDWTKKCNVLFDKFTVEWAQNLMGWYPATNNGYEPDETWWDDWTVEVIGNIYENPDLDKVV
jgi:uncharacterized phage protein (TIGR01671 family)